MQWTAHPHLHPASGSWRHCGWCSATVAPNNWPPASLPQGGSHDWQNLIIMIIHILSNSGSQWSDTGPRPLSFNPDHRLHQRRPLCNHLVGQLHQHQRQLAKPGRLEGSLCGGETSGLWACGAGSQSSAHPLLPLHGRGGREGGCLEHGHRPVARLSTASGEIQIQKCPLMLKTHPKLFEA